MLNNIYQNGRINDYGVGVELEYKKMESIPLQFYIRSGDC